jgi:energy-converting hydrogenase Eha subunit E
MYRTPDRLSAPVKEKWSATVAFLFAAAVFGVLALHTLDSSKTAASLSVITMLLAGMTAYWRFKAHGLDALGLFCTAFAGYDGLLLFRLATVSGEEHLVYPSAFGQETYADVGILVALAATVICITALSWETVIAPLFRQGTTGSRTQSELRRRGPEMWFWAGSISYIGGLIMYFLQYAQLGGYFATLAMDRGERYSAGTYANLLSYPFAAFVVPGLAGMFLGAYSGNSRGQRIWSWSLASVWCCLLILQGDRRLVLQALLAIVGVFSIVRPKMLRLRFRTWVLLFLGYAFLSMFGHVRYLINPIVSGQTGAREAFAEVSDNASEEWFTPENTELAGPYYSLLSVVSESTQHLYGKSYYDSFLLVIPKRLYLGEKPELLTRQFDEQVHQGGGTVYGWGYNPVAEAYLNFGTVGVALIFVLWSLLFLGLGFIKHQATWGLLVFAVLLPEAVNANRIDFGVVYTESVYMMVGVLSVVCMNRVFSGFRGGKVRNSTAGGSIR